MRLKDLFLIMVLSLILILIWFKEGNLLGAGETGVQFYNLKALLGISGWAWGNQVLGGVSGVTVSGAPFYAFLYLLQKSGVSGFFLQASFFFLLISLTLFSMYLLTGEIFPKISFFARLSSALFYLLNPFSLMNIWNRFLTNPMLFYALFPLAFFLLIRGLRLKKYYYAVFLSLLTAFFSFAFSAPAQTIIFWSSIFGVSVFYFFFIRKDLFLFRFLAVLFLSWFLFNFWWISQQILFRFSESFTVSTEEFFTTESNYSTFKSISESLGRLRNVILLQHGPFFTKSKDLPYSWSLIYTHSISLFVQWLVTLIVLVLAIRKQKSKWIAIFLTLFIFGIFIIKGNAQPLGEIFDIAFRKISILQFFRNPFEKLGIIPSLSLSILFGTAIGDLIESARRGNKKLISEVGIFIVLIYLFVFLGFPYFSGLVFSSGNPPANDPSVNYQVKVPEYYKGANSWLSSQEGIFRFISFPLGGEGIFHRWEKGYAGIELSGVLFDTPNISYNTTIPFFSNIAKSLEELFITRSDFYKIASILNAKYIMLRKDLDFALSGMRDPETIDAILEDRVKNPQARLSSPKVFGELEFFKFDDDVFLPKIYPAKKILWSNGRDLGVIFWGNFGKQDALGVYKDKLENSELPDGNVVLKPNAIFRLKDQVFEYTEEPNVLPYSAHSPSSLFYSYVLLKEKVTDFFILDRERKAEFQITLLGKRLVEAKSSLVKTDHKDISRALFLYLEQLPEMIALVKSLPPDTTFHAPIWNPGFLREVFGTHLILLEQLESLTSGVIKDEVIKTKSIVSRMGADLFVISKNTPIISDNFPLLNRQIYQFKVEEEGEYELIFPESKISDYFEMPEKMIIQINDKTEERKVKKGENYISFGLLNLDKGFNEVEFNLPSQLNLVENSRQVAIETEDEVKTLDFPIRNFDPYTSYNIELSYYIRSGVTPKIFLAGNTDPYSLLEERFLRNFENRLPQDNYWFDFREFSTMVTPNRSADSTTISFEVEPWNNCELLLAKTRERCKDKLTKKSFNRKTEISIKDIKLTKAFFKDPLLTRVSGNFSEREVPEVSFERIDQTKYKVYVKKSQEPFLLVFSELFDPSWKAFFLDGVNTSDLPEEEHLLVNGYANSWWIDRKGDFEIILEYVPQRLLTAGYIFSGTGILFGSFIFVWLKKRNR